MRMACEIQDHVHKTPKKTNKTMAKATNCSKPELRPGQETLKNREREKEGQFLDIVISDHA